jgi:hypothetical protein
MKEVFRGPDMTRVGQFQGILEAEGIPTFVRNENVSATHVPVPVFAPSLCVMEDDDYDRAVELIRSYREAPPAPPGEELRCAKCGETSPANFSECWNCGAELAGP